MGRVHGAALMAAMALAAAGAARAEGFTVQQALDYPFVDHLVRAPHGDRIAWVRNVDGVRNIWVADAAGLTPRQLTQFNADDGLELTGLTFSPDGSVLLFVRGGDHDANWPAKGDLAPDPTSSPVQPKVTLWVADPSGAKPARALTEGDEPAISSLGEVAYLKEGAVWTVKLDGSGAHRLFFDRGKDGELAWAPDGGRLAFTSDREDHAFIGLYESPEDSLHWIAPSTNRAGAPAWSPDGRRIAFTRREGIGGAPEPILTPVPHPWAIWTADAETGAARRIWASPVTLRGSYPQYAGEANLNWGQGGLVTFLSAEDNWPHLYAVADRQDAGPARLLTPGAYMVEHIDMSPDHSAIVYSANSGKRPGDDDRRHIFRVPLSGGAPVELTEGETLEWTPVALEGEVAFIGADPKNPPSVQVTGARGRHELPGQAPPADFPAARFVVPKPVIFKAPDGTTVHGQLFQAKGAKHQPGLIFVHGGPPRQMMLGWSYMDYYSHAYAMNQWYAAHGYTVLAVNYRLGIGYGFDFKHPAHAGATGSSEYQDVLAGGRVLQQTPGVDPARVGIWGGSYGGLLTALGLARNSDVFKAGVDFHGVHDWSRTMAERNPTPLPRFEQGDRAAATETAFKASPDADIASWTSPVLLIQGDDDRNVRFNQTIDLANRLAAKGVPFEELVIPDEIHGFLRHASWLKADLAATDFLSRKLGGEK